MPSNFTNIPTYSARNLSNKFDSSLPMPKQISLVSKSCFLSIHNLRRIWYTMDYYTAHTIATSLIHSKLDYYNSLFLNHPKSKVGHFNPFLLYSSSCFLKFPNYVTYLRFWNHFWLKIEQRIKHKILTITDKHFYHTNLANSLACSIFNTTGPKSLSILTLFIIKLQTSSNNVTLFTVKHYLCYWVFYCELCCIVIA